MFLSARLVFASVVLSLLTGAGVRADILTLANGDKLKGTLIRNVDDMITFKSDILGEIVVPTTKASVQVELTPEQKAALAKAAEEKRLAAAKAADEKKKTDAAKAPVKKPKATSFSAVDLRTAARTPDRATKVDDTGWINRIEFGLTNQSGRTEKVDIYLRTENNRRTPKTETRFLNRYTYGETEGQRTADSLSSNLRFRRTLTGRVFLQSNTRFDRDRITLVAADAEQGIGLGCNVLSSKTIVVAAGTDAAVRYRSYMSKNSATAAKPDETTTVFDIFQDMSLSINPRLSLTQDFLLVVNPDNSDDHKYNFNAGLTGKITNTFNITTRIELEYNKLLPPDLRYNQRVTTTLGYVF